MLNTLWTYLIEGINIITSLDVAKLIGYLIVLYVKYGVTVNVYTAAFRCGIFFLVQC